MLGQSILGMGTILAIFYSYGNAPLLNESVVRLVATLQAQDFSILAEMSSAPDSGSLTRAWYTLATRPSLSMRGSATPDYQIII